MKKIFNIAAFAIAAVTVFTACNDDDTTVVYDPAANNLGIVSQETTFGAAPSSGTILVDATDPVTVTSNAGEWLTTEVEGNKITVNVAQNNSLDGRTGTLTITSGAKKTDISVIQSGAIFSLGDVSAIYSDDDANTFEYKVKANLPVTFTANDDFVTAEYDEATNTLTVKLTANETGHMRCSDISYTCGSVEGEISVSQCDFDKDLAGAYDLLYYKQDVLYGIAAEIKKTGSNYSLELPAFGFSIPVAYNSSNFSITLPAGSHVGDYGAYKVVIGITGEDGYVMWDSSISMTASFINGTLANGIRLTMAEFEDDGTYEGSTANGFGLLAFTKLPAKDDDFQGGLLWLDNPVLRRIDEMPSARSAVPAKARAHSEYNIPELKLTNNYRIRY